MPIISVELPRPAHRYDIVLEPGVGRRWREEIAARVPAGTYLAAVDSRLARMRGLPGAGAAEGRWRWLHVEAGEENKTFGRYERLCLDLLAAGVDRGSVVVALGGGVVGDIVGFAAATVMRGVRFVQVPTTLLAQIDSSVGGKTGIDTPLGKNLVGAFHQPELVLVDPEFLATLPRREYLAGLAEMVKTAVLDGSEFFGDIRDHVPALLEMRSDYLARAIARCCRFKADVVAADEREKGGRALLNLGHTFGHALESLAGYDGAVVHGEAVAVGMALAADFAVDGGLLDRGTRDGIVGLLAALGLPVAVAELGRAGGREIDWRTRLRRGELAAVLSSDKKNAGGRVNLVLPRALGDCRVEKGFDAGAVADFIIARAGV